MFLVYFLCTKVALCAFNDNLLIKKRKKKFMVKSFGDYFVFISCLLNFFFAMFSFLQIFCKIFRTKWIWNSCVTFFHVIPFSYYNLVCVTCSFLLKQFRSYPFCLKALSWPSSLSFPSRLSKWKVHTCIQQGSFIYWSVGTCKGFSVQGHILNFFI